MTMREEYLLALLMLGLVAVVEICTRNHPKWWAPALLLAAVAGSLVAGMGLRFREIVEGPFGFLDALLPCVVAMIFLRVLKDGGAWDRLFARLQGKSPLLTSFGMLLFLALPGMLTGFAAASVLMSAKPVYDLLMKKGAPKAKSVGFIAVGAFLGMMLPPNCAPAIVASNGAGSVLPTPYVGFFLPLLVLSGPAFLLFGLMSAPLFKGEAPDAEKGKLLPLLPLAIVLALVLVDGLLGSYVYVGGQALIFLIGVVLAFLLPAKRRGPKAVFDTLIQGVTDIAVPVAAVFALGSFIEVSSMNGIRGIFSYHILPYSVTAVMLVLMAISVVLGFVLSAPLPAFLITYAVFPIGWLANTVIVTGCAAAVGVALLIACRGGVISRVKEELGVEDVSYGDTVKQLLLPALLVLIMGIVMVVFGDRMTGIIL
jgi:TRAP-type C4-dicarboxylate transport system permease large subunit